MVKGNIFIHISDSRVKSNIYGGGWNSHVLGNVNIVIEGNENNLDGGTLFGGSRKRETLRILKSQLMAGHLEMYMVMGRVPLLEILKAQ